MEGILTELSQNDISRINEKVSCKVPVLAVPNNYKRILNNIYS